MRKNEGVFADYINMTGFVPAMKPLPRQVRKPGTYTGLRGWVKAENFIPYTKSHPKRCKGEKLHILQNEWAVP